MVCFLVTVCTRIRLRVKLARTQRHLLAQQASGAVVRSLPVTKVLMKGKRVGSRYCMVTISMCGDTYMAVGTYFQDRAPAHLLVGYNNGMRHVSRAPYLPQTGQVELAHRVAARFLII